MHTPSPWEAYAPLVHTPNNRIHIKVSTDHLRDFVDFNDEIKANARLIAAAPDMFEAIELFLSVDPTEITTKFEAKLLMERAMRKAKGEDTE